MAVDPNIKKKADDIRNKVYGREVRESLASGLEAISSDVVETVGRQDEVESQFQDVIENTTDKDVISAPEIINARDGEPNLKARLDKEHQKVTAQLAQTKSLLQKGKKDKRPLVVLTSDDAVDNDKRLLMPIMLEKNVSIGFGAVTSTIGQEGKLDFEELRELEQAGGEILCHSHTHPNFAFITDEERITELETSLNIFHANGIYPQGFIYPFNDNNLASEMIVSRYFNYAYSRSYLTLSGRNFPILNNQNIERVALDPDTDVDPNHPNLVTNTLEYYKAKVDEGVANNSIVAFMMHGNTMDATQLSHLRDLIDYVRSIGVEIVSPKEAFNIAGNIVEIKTENHDFRISADGQYVGQNLSIVEKVGNRYTVDDTLGTFRDNAVTHSFVTGSNTTGFPNNSPGILTTYRVGNQWAFVKQEYRPYNARGLWQRTVELDGSWSEWKDLSIDDRNAVELVGNVYTALTPFNEFPLGITTSYVTGSNTTGFPNNSAGILTTYHLGNQWAFSKQEYRPYNARGLWQRTVELDGSWSEWENLNKEEKNFIQPVGNKYTAQTPISDFPIGRIVTSVVTGSQTTGMPNNKAGVLTTYRVSSEYGFWRQEVKPYMETGTWERLVLSDRTWGDWVKITN